MNIGQEKEHLYSMMREITLERRRLTDLYFELKQRLNDLYKLEQKGLTDLDLKGYVDLHNKINRETMVKNIKRESENAIKKIEKEYSSKPVKPEDEVSKLIEKEKKKYGDNKKRKNYMSYERIKSLISSILIDGGRPMNVDEILEGVNSRVDNYQLSRKNLGSNILYKIMRDKDSNIERASYGFYQYKK